MAAFNEVGAGGTVNVSAVVGAEVRNVSRNGTTVSFQYRAYIYQNTNTYSTNTWALWVEGAQNNVKGRGASSQWTKYYTGWYSKSVSLGTGSSSVNISIGVNGNAWNPGSPSGYVTLTLGGLPTASPPSLSGLSISGVTDTKANVSFNINSSNNASVTDSYIDLSYSNFGATVKTINNRSGTFTGLEPNRTYYARGNAANAAGRAYTGVSSFKTSFTKPGNPGKPSITYDQTEPIPRAHLTIKWSAASAGSKAVAGYRIKLYKNGSLIDTIVTTNNSTSYTFNKTLEDYGFIPNDIVKVSVEAYSNDWNNTKFYSGSEINSNNLTVVSDKFIYTSTNGEDLEKHKAYISINGGEFKEIKKEKLKVIE